MARLAERVRAARVPHSIVAVPYAQHAFDYLWNGWGAQVVRAIVLDFLLAYGGLSEAVEQEVTDLLGAPVGRTRHARVEGGVRRSPRGRSSAYRAPASASVSSRTTSLRSASMILTPSGVPSSTWRTTSPIV